MFIRWLALILVGLQFSSTIVRADLQAELNCYEQLDRSFNRLSFDAPRSSSARMASGSIIGVASRQGANPQESGFYRINRGHISWHSFPFAFPTPHNFVRFRFPEEATQGYRFEFQENNYPLNLTFINRSTIGDPDTPESQYPTLRNAQAVTTPAEMSRVRELFMTEILKRISSLHAAFVLNTASLVRTNISRTDILAPLQTCDRLRIPVIQSAVEFQRQLFSNTTPPGRSSLLIDSLNQVRRGFIYVHSLNNGHPQVERLYMSEIQGNAFEDLCDVSSCEGGQMHCYQSPVVRNLHLVNSCTNRIPLGTIRNVNYTFTEVCSERHSYSGTARYRIARQADGLHLQLKQRLLITPPTASNAESLMALERTRECVPIFQRKFQSYGLKLDLEIDSDRNPSGPAPDHQIMVSLDDSSSSRRSNENEFYFHGINGGQTERCTSHCAAGTNIPVTAQCRSRCERIRQNEYCAMAFHELGHMFGLEDEYRDSACPLREFITSGSFPPSVMEESSILASTQENNWEIAGELYPRHIERILESVCPRR